MSPSQQRKRFPPICVLAWTNAGGQLITHLANEIIGEDKIYCAAPQLSISPGSISPGSPIPRCRFLLQSQSFQMTWCAQEASIPQPKAEVCAPVTWQQTQACTSEEEKAKVWRRPGPRTPCPHVSKIWFVSPAQTGISLGLQADQGKAVSG